MAKFSKEEKEQAVELAKRTGVSAASARTGIKAKTIYSWLDRKAKKEQVLDSNGIAISPEEMSSRIIELEKEIKQLQNGKLPCHHQERKTVSTRPKRDDLQAG